MRQMLGAFAKQYIRPVAMKHDREESMPWALMKQAQGFGMTQTAVVDGRKALTGKDDDDGAGKPKSQSRLGVVGSEELAYGCAGVCLAIGGSGLAASPVARMGTEEQKQEFRRLLKGEDEHGHIKVAAMALSEPSTGSDISSLSTTARADGDYFVLNGHKQWITNGQSAAAYVVWAQTDPSAGRAGVRGFLVARGTPGLIPGRKEHKLGIRASETAQVHFEDCRVHKDLMLGIGASSEGLGDTKKMLDSTRPMVGAQAVGIARAAFDYLVERVAGGTIHGSALKHHQHVAFELAEMEMEIQAARALVHKAAWMADHGQDNVRMASIAKAYGAKVAQDVTARALTLLGEEALEPDHPVEKWYRDAKIYDIFEGTGQIQRRIIARSILGVNAS
ncbi:MAG: acyl-CoA dehydrogenase family protein [Kofleriaceae bacterium]|nr:acyl-CoA dehydrogenase family protein [Kofleriaceae bacterium]MBP9168135.1 acyl-CoA dehydrogenase family protein [Kofleriaceae bacterium]MBP9856487.1 acyl-CoA dehydrogenase family protein [Kofleriaceae bacterium]